MFEFLAMRMLVRTHVHDVIGSPYLRFYPLCLSLTSIIERRAALHTAFPTESPSFHDLNGSEGSYAAILGQMIRYCPGCFQGEIDFCRLTQTRYGRCSNAEHDHANKCLLVKQDIQSKSRCILPLAVAQVDGFDIPRPILIGKIR